MPASSKIHNFIIIALLPFLCSGCLTLYNPATQRNEFILINTSSEVALGRDMDRQVQRKFKIADDPLRQGRLNDIGKKIAASSDRRDLTYYFRAVKNDELNAFAIPGGFIYVNSGLMDRATDSELACVLAHEVGHVAARHSVKKLQAALGYQIVANIALGLSGNTSMVNAMNIVFDAVNLGYSRQDEFLADKLAVKYAKRGGFDPYGMITFFRKLQAEEKRRGQGFRLVFLSSHPPIEERIKKAETEIANVYDAGQ